MAIFPQDMLNKPLGSDMSLEGIAAKLVYFHTQLHLIHWQTSMYAEHQAMNLYDYVHDFLDTVMEKMMGYTGAKPRAFKFLPITDGASAVNVVTELKQWSAELASYAGTNGYADIENIAQELSGEAAKTLYLLTLS